MPPRRPRDGDDEREVARRLRLSLLAGLDGDARARLSELHALRLRNRQKTQAARAQAEQGGMPSEECFWDRFACLHAMLQLAEPANED